jgi:murein DD-endopeptidase MepM/ murein hydrolase activator NlpD
MKKRTRSRLEMGVRALEFSRAHPDESAGYTAAVAELAALLTRSEQLTDQQRQGTSEVRSATERKRELRRSIRQGQLVHVARAAQRAAKEVPELTQKFALAREPIPYLTFRSLARTVAAEAQERKELLVKHGLVDRVLDGLNQSLDQFDQAMGQGAEGRRLHVAAAVELTVAGNEVVQIVRMIDGLNRVRFAGDPDLLAAWKAKPEAPEAPPAAGAVKPAA